MPQSNTSPRLNALATAVPSYLLKQEDVAAYAGRLFAAVPGGFHRLESVYRNAEIETRHSCVPLEWYLSEHGFGERNALFLENAIGLLEQAATKALREAGLQAQDIDTIVTITSSGIATPSLDAHLMGFLPFRADVMRVPLFGLGCAGGVLGLSRAAALAKAEPTSNVLLLCVELCGLTFRHADRSKSNIVASALFGDGAAAAVISCKGEGPKLGPWGEHTWPNSLDIMGWDVVDDGLKVVFARSIPTLVQEDLRPVLDTFLARHNWTLKDMDGFQCHPGGAKVIDALENCLEVEPGSLTTSRDVLRAHGNMSAVTILFVLREAIDKGARGRQLLTTLGPGFTAAFLVTEMAG